MKRSILWAILIVFLGLIGWQAYHKLSSSKNNSDQRRNEMPLAVEIMPISKASIQDIRSFTGTLESESTFMVAPKIAGRLQELNFNIGDQVQEGRMIARLDNEEYLQQVDQARAELDVARANLEETRNLLELAKKDLERISALRQKNIASESEQDAVESRFRSQEAKFKVTEAQIKQKEAALKAAQVRLSYTQIRLPEGHEKGYWVVGERFVDQGAMVAANAPLLSLLNLRSLVAVINVVERDYAKIKIGMPAQVQTDAFPDKHFNGRISRIASVLKEASRQARVEIAVPNEQRVLKPGMFVRVALKFEEHADATVVPMVALVKRTGVEGVFTVDTQTKRARFIPILTGIASETQVEVLQPKLQGWVVTLGQHLLVDNAAITWSESKADQPAKLSPLPEKNS